MKTINPAGRNAVAAGLILLLALAAYSNSFSATFNRDDFHQILNNPNVRDINNLTTFFTDIHAETYLSWLKFYRPITSASFAISYALSGYHPFGYHLFNFLVHLLNSFLVFLVVSIVMREAGDKDGFRVPLIVSLVFAVHPIQTSAVTYVSGRAALLASMFYLLSFYSFLRFRTGSKGAALYVWAAIAPVFYLMGLLSKEMAVSLPAVMLCHDLIFNQPGGKGFRKTLKAGAYYISFFSAFAAYFLVRKLLTGYNAFQWLDYSPGVYLMTQARVLLMYLRLLIFPMNQNADYDMPATLSIDAMVVLSAALVVLTVILLFRVRRTLPAVAFFGFWSFIAHAPESSVISIRDLAVEYRLYLPSVGFIASFIILTANLVKQPGLRRSLAFSVIILFGVLTYTRNSAWATEYTLMSDTVKKSPHSARVHSNLGKALLYEGRYRDAMRELQLSLKLNPPPGFDYYVVYRNIGLCYYYTGRLSEAEDYLARALKEMTDEPDLQVSLGMVYDAEGRYREALGMFENALVTDPDFANAHFYASKVYTKMGEKKKALDEMLEAQRLSPKEFRTNYALAYVYYNNGMVSQATRQAEAALEFAGDDVQRKLAEEFLARLRNGRR